MRDMPGHTLIHMGRKQETGKESATGEQKRFNGKEHSLGRNSTSLCRIGEGHTHTQEKEECSSSRFLEEMIDRCKK